ncbi:M23 family metallopeptidase [Antrihabitans sp. YC3-6]|uniref:M23 family metallopeptidase n=1 Tax=Antrihabitans stalagmiti TaxID=2799499 RepID=A0A934NSS5_9NOCA|nr:M23 family metallopeptidase [Antrihabitans stalagmiti]MBJ8340843.1 M23 family metallopeptidase [Antrihabitans stalagmiti]
MRRSPAHKGSTGHRPRSAVQAVLGLGMLGGLVAFAPAVSAAPGDSPAREAHLRGEVADILIESLRAIGSSGALDELAGPTGRITSCLVDVTTSPSTTPTERPGALATITPCIGAVNDVDPTVLTGLLTTLPVGKLVSTLAAAKTPHDPSLEHGPDSDATTPPLTADPRASRVVPSDESTSEPAQRTRPDRTRPNPTLPGSAKFVAPTSGEITSPFGDGRNHEGIDIANSVGTPIVAVADGKVISAGPAQGFGLWVRIRHDDGTVTTYGHNNNNGVAVGQRVRAGQQIATVGNRGISSGPHLHFEVASPTGEKVDPVDWLDERDAGISDADIDS